MHTNLIILAGGASSRMKKPSVSDALSTEEIAQANERSKGLISIGPENRPLLDYLLYNAKKAGYKDIYIVISEQGGLFKEYYGNNQKDNKFHGLNISFAIQYVPKDRDKPLGTADALYQAIQQYPELNSGYYSVFNSDNLYSKKAMYALRQVKSANALISYDREAFLFPFDRVSGFAVVKLNGDNDLTDIIEKPSPDTIEKYKDSEGKVRVSMNAFRFKGDMIYPYLRDCPIHPVRKEKELPTVLLNMLKDHPGEVKTVPFSEHVPDLTAKDDIISVKEYLIQHYPRLEWNEPNV